MITTEKSRYPISISGTVAGSHGYPKSFRIGLKQFEIYHIDDMDTIECLLSAYPLYSEDLKIDLSQPSGRFQWFLASILFGARISEKIAAQTYRTFQEAGIDTLEEILVRRM